MSIETLCCPGKCAGCRGRKTPAQTRFGDTVRELVRTNNPVLVSAVGALLEGAGIQHLVFDRNMSVMEGSVGILASRIMVTDEDVAAARRLLQEAGLGHELRPDAT